MQEVEVWLFASKLGHLVGTSPDHWSFVMNPREDLGVPLGSDALSLLFPTREGTWEGMQVRQWFQQFLPEPEILRPLCRRLGLSSTNEIALLGALGGDCPGAISFRTPMTEGVIGEGVHRLLSPDELRHLVAALPERPLLVDVEGAVPPAVIKQLTAINGVLRVRYLPS